MEHKPTQRVLNILNLLSTNPNGLTLTEISETLDIPKSTIYPIMQTMLKSNFVSIEKGTLKYSIGISAFRIGSSYSRNKYILDFIQKVMKNIVNNINETCQMGILDGNNVLYILKEDPKKDMDIRLISYIGKRIPAYCTALGKAILAQYDIEKIKSLYPNGLKPITKNTITDFHTLKKQLDIIRKTNVAKEYEEVTEFICCYAVPIQLKNNTTAALSISIPTFRINKEKEKLAIQLLLDAKDQIQNSNIDWM